MLWYPSFPPPPLLFNPFNSGFKIRTWTVLQTTEAKSSQHNTLIVSQEGATVGCFFSCLKGTDCVANNALLKPPHSLCVTAVIPFDMNIYRYIPSPHTSPDVPCGSSLFVPVVLILQLLHVADQLNEYTGWKKKKYEEGDEQTLFESHNKF